MLRADHEGDVQHDEAVEQLRDGGGARGAQPHPALAGHRADAVKHRHVDQLPDQERNDGPDDRPHALPEDQRIGLLDVRDAQRRVRVHPERCRRQRDGHVGGTGRPRR